MPLEDRHRTPNECQCFNLSDAYEAANKRVENTRRDALITSFIQGDLEVVHLPLQSNQILQAAMKMMTLKLFTSKIMNFFIYFHRLLIKEEEKIWTGCNWLFLVT